MSEFNEPWSEGVRERRGDEGILKFWRVLDASSRPVIDFRNDDHFGVPWFWEKRHLERVVACVNFCRNLPTDWLEKHVATSLVDTFQYQFPRDAVVLEFEETSE